jgi:hypothetical protein
MSSFLLAMEESGAELEGGGVKGGGTVDGDVEIRNGTEIWVFFNRSFREFSNFTMTISGHGKHKEDGGTLYILTCTLTDGSQFSLSISISDLDEFSSFYKEKFNKENRPSNTRVSKKAGIAGNMHTYIVGLIREYEKPTTKKKKVIIANGIGFYKDESLGGRIYIAGKDSAIPGTEKMDESKIKSCPIMWGGQDNADFVVGPKLTGERAVEILKQLETYHGRNFPTILAFIGYSSLAMNRPEIQRKGLCLPTYHLIGQMSSGKSHGGRHMQCLLPCIKTGENSYSVRSDPNVTEYVLKDMITTERPPLVLDPPPQFAKKANLNSFLDHTYQGNAQKSRYDKKDKCLSTGLLMIWAHEKSTLPDCQPTALSKCFLGVHAKSDNFDNATNGKLHQEMIDNCYEMSGFFREMVLPLDAKELTEKQYLKTTEAVAQFSDRIDKSTLSSFDRVIGNHMLIAAALDLVLSRLAAGEDWTERYSQLLMDHIIQRSLPAAFSALQSVKGTITTHALVSDEELMIQFESYLKKLPVKAFFECIAFTATEVVFSSRILIDKPEFVKIVERTDNEKRTHFVHPHSDKPWYKRDNKNKFIYGKSTKVSGYALQFKELNPQLQEIINIKVVKLLSGDNDEDEDTPDNSYMHRNVTVLSDPAVMHKTVTEFFDQRFLTGDTSAGESTIEAEMDENTAQHETCSVRTCAAASTMTDDLVYVTTEEKHVQTEVYEHSDCIIPEDIEGLNELSSFYKQMSTTQRLFTLNGAASLLQGNSRKEQNTVEDDDQPKNQSCVRDDEENARSQPEVENKEREPEPEPMPYPEEPKGADEEELVPELVVITKDSRGEKQNEDKQQDTLQEAPFEMQTGRAGGEVKVPRGRGRGRVRGSKGLNRGKGEIGRPGNRSGGQVLKEIDRNEEEDEVCKTVMDRDIPEIQDCIP